MKQLRVANSKKRLVWRQPALVIAVIAGVAIAGGLAKAQDDSQTAKNANQGSAAKQPVSQPTSVSVNVSSGSPAGEDDQQPAPASVTVNGQDIDVPANGSFQKNVVSGDGNSQVNINVQSNGDSSNSSSSVSVNSSSSTFTN